MANKPKKVSQHSMDEIFTAFKVCLLDHPDGCGSTDVWEGFYKDKFSFSHVCSAMSELERNGYTKFVGYRNKRKLFLPTGKEFLPTQPADKDTAQKAKPQPLFFTPTNPDKPHEWIDDLNKVIAGLELLQAAIPGLKCGLLDLTKNLERLEKVKEIVGDVAKAARRNV